jgi:hypothetical protein
MEISPVKSNVMAFKGQVPVRSKIGIDNIIWEQIRLHITIYVFFAITSLFCGFEVWALIQKHIRRLKAAGENPEMLSRIHFIRL